MIEITHILWDWNGTLLDDVPACVAALNGILEGAGLGPVTEDQYRDQFGFPVQDYYIRLGFDFEKQDWHEVSVTFNDLYLQHAKDTPLRADVAATLESLRSRGIPMSVLSASNTDIVESMTRLRGIRDYFANIHGLDTLHADSKLSAGAEFLRQAGIPPGRVLMVGDTDHDHEVASELGFRCVLIRGGHQSEERLAQRGCNVIDRISQVDSLLATW